MGIILKVSFEYYWLQMSRTNVGIEIYVLRVQCAGTNESDIIIIHIEICAEKLRQFCETYNVI